MAGDTVPGEERIRRFSPIRIIEHWMHVLLFTTLVCTGLAQRFSTAAASEWFILRLGGIDAVRIIHRTAGVLFTLAVLTHLAAAIVGVVFRKWQPAMIITKQDFLDAVRTVRYYLGLAEAPAAQGRYTYKQKFEYWAIVTGALIMMASGFVLWFPVWTTAILPGEVIPAAKVLHANEALVVFLIVALWHIYNAIFSPEVFPFDTSILTGYLSRERMLREHPLEYADAGGGQDRE